MSGLSALADVDAIHSRGEPADPPEQRIDHEERRNIRLCPPESVRVEDLPHPFIECGCGNCPPSVDPLADVLSALDDEVSPPTTYAGERCSSPKPMTVGRARKVYLAYQRAKWQQKDRTSKLGQSLDNYATILEGDRRIRQRFDGLTTVMLTRRVSPLDDRGQWRHPLEIDASLNASEVRRAVKRSLRYQLGNHEFEYVAATAPTTTASTPHEHLLYWIQDPQDQITVQHAETALEKHLELCPRAREEDHRYRVDGTDGAITVQHAPSLVDQVPERAAEIFDQSEATYVTDDGTRLPANTRGAQYLASQLAHLVLDSVINGTVDPQHPTVDGGAIAWVSNKRWFRRSGGL